MMHQPVSVAPSCTLMCSLDHRSGRKALVLLLVVCGAIVGLSSCRSVLSVRYEYDEELYLALDGSATLYVNASVPALVALRGAPLDVNPRARLDRNDVRAFFESDAAEVANVTTSRRENRRYVHVRLEVPDVRRLTEAPAFAWSHYELVAEENRYVFRQRLAASAARDVGSVGWLGNEMVAFRLHLPSRVTFHNSPTREVERGNIIRWEQRLVDRLKGEPLTVEVHMDDESILAQTLTLFAATALAALGTLALAVWLVARRSRRENP
jgi:hypothetical protein